MRRRYRHIPFPPSQPEQWVLPRLILSTGPSVAALLRTGRVMQFPVDRLIFGPDDVDLARSPLAGHFDAETYVLGAFNPGLTRLANGNLLMMVRIAEALRKPIEGGHVHCIRWADGRYRLDAWLL